MLIAQDLIFVCLGYWLHRTCSCFASDADRTRLQLGLPRMLIAQDLIWLFVWAHTSDASLVEIWSSLKILIDWNLSSFSPKVFLKLLSSVRPFFILHFIFQIGKHGSDAVCRVIYDCAWMKCSCIGFNFMFFFLSNLPHSRPCILCRPVGAVFFSFALWDISVSILAHHIVSYFSFLKTRHSCSSL